MRRHQKFTALGIIATVAFISVSVRADVLFSDDFDRSTTLNNGVNFIASNPDPGPWTGSTLSNDGSDGQLSAAAAREGSAGFRLYVDGTSQHRLDWTPATEPVVTVADKYVFDVRFNDSTGTRNYAMMQVYYANDASKDAISLYRFDTNVQIRMEQDGSGSGNYFGTTNITMDTWYRFELTHNASEGKVNFKVTNLDTSTVVNDVDWTGTIAAQTAIDSVKFGLPYSGNNSSTGHVDIDNFSVIDGVVPEPGSAAAMMLLMSGATMLRSRR